MEEVQRVYKVSELNADIKEILRFHFSDIWVEGEVSGFKISSVGHWHFDLKDENSIISCVVFRWVVNNDTSLVELKDGIYIRVLAELTTFDRQSKYQLVVKKIIPLSIGELYIKFERLKKKLEAEGLFDPKRKRKIPPFPSYVGVVTSLHGAAVRDIISVIKRRAPHINIIIYPVKVQGEDAKDEIANAIKELNENLPYIDVLLVGRGGGSIEDLWAFNEEIVARAIANSKIPVISCVGHQTDFTIADFVSDLRAPTPSAAAEIVSKNAQDVITYLKQLEKRLISSLKIMYHRIKSRFFIFINSRVYRNPFSIIESKSILLDELTEGLFSNIDEKIKSISNKLENLSARLKNLNPILPTRKGYAIVKKMDRIVKSIKDVEEGDLIDLTLSDGIINSQVNRVVKSKGLL